MNEQMVRDHLIDHSKSSKNGRFPIEATFTAKLTNPFCGDHVELRIQSDGTTVHDIGFKASACAMCSASASILISEVKDKNIDLILSWATLFEDTLSSNKNSQWPPELSAFACFKHLKVNPARKNVRSPTLGCFEISFKKINKGNFMKITTTINGNQKTLEVEEDMPILWALRDVAGLTGTKFGCGRGLCGACTVHLDGEAIRSCVTPMSEASGKKIVTIEGLSTDGSHPVQKCWVENGVPQCGFCQPGQIMSATAFLRQNKKPNDQDIAEAMAGNLCRCGTYTRIRDAIKEVAANGGKV